MKSSYSDVGEEAGISNPLPIGITDIRTIKHPTYFSKVRELNLLTCYKKKLNKDGFHNLP